jgi:hypothetical protein
VGELLDLDAEDCQRTWESAHVHSWEDLPGSTGLTRAHVDQHVCAKQGLVHQRLNRKSHHAHRNRTEQAVKVSLILLVKFLRTHATHISIRISIAHSSQTSASM